MSLSRAVPRLGLYVHVPWCVRKCPYCDFNSHGLRRELPEQDYVAALLGDLDADLALVGARRVSSLFIGGGTPSLLSPRALGRLLEGIAARVALGRGCEITLEANPGAVDEARFSGFRAAGVTRLSLGVQSFDDAGLASLGRIHDAQTAHRAVRAALAAGFERVNVDLMFALPGQTLRQAVRDVEQAVAYAPDHISHYQLTLEPGTAFHRRPPRLPDPDRAWAMQSACLERLAAAGYRRYEVSAHARAGARCRHNLNYWRFGDYLGIGAGAHDKITAADGSSVTRRMKHKAPGRYLDAVRAGDAVAEKRRVHGDELAFECLLNGLRLESGISERRLARAAGTPSARVRHGLDLAVQRGLLRREGGVLRPSELGGRFLDDLLVLLLPAESERAS